MTTVVHIAETAFLSILVSAIEAFPSKFEGKKKPKKSFPEGEVYGLLFGQRISKNNSKVFHTIIATPMQIISGRTPAMVFPSAKHSERIKSVIQAYPMYQFLGTFHSHPWRKDEYKGMGASRFSPFDEQSAIEDASTLHDEIIEVIIGLTCLGKSMKKQPDRHSACIQSYCGNYKYSLAAFVTDTSSEKLSKVDNLICPFASGVGNDDLNV